MLGDVIWPTLCVIVDALLCLAVPYALVPFTFPVYPETCTPNKATESYLSNMSLKI